MHHAQGHRCTARGGGPTRQNDNGMYARSARQRHIPSIHSFEEEPPGDRCSATSTRQAFQREVKVEGGLWTQACQPRLACHAGIQNAGKAR